MATSVTPISRNEDTVSKSNTEPVALPQLSHRKFNPYHNREEKLKKLRLILERDVTERLKERDEVIRKQKEERCIFKTKSTIKKQEDEKRK